MQSLYGPINGHGVLNTYVYVGSKVLYQEISCASDLMNIDE